MVSRAIFFLALFWVCSVYAGAQQYEHISYSNRQELRNSLNSNQLVSSFQSPFFAVDWLSKKSNTLKNKIPDDKRRLSLLRMIHYEATRYGLDPNLVLALIEVESGFDRFALSPVGASGLMQVMPFWKELIGTTKDSLFDEQTNLRYGCIILRYYLDMEHENLSRGLARYNGSLGSIDYSELVLRVWREKFSS